ncbi:hypothetical protein AX14_006947 [Amanita brunnescens Koide BX004]|nr:hypothetical protein AX14_006947 [Amanita brunnescens Koide BX004]
MGRVPNGCHANSIITCQLQLSMSIIVSRGSSHLRICMQVFLVPLINISNVYLIVAFPLWISDKRMCDVRCTNISSLPFFARRNTNTLTMKFFSTATVVSFLVTISFMSNVAVAMPVESSSGGVPAGLAKRQDFPASLPIVGSLIGPALGGSSDAPPPPAEPSSASSS